MGCLTQFAKYILFCFNLLIVICAIALIAVGAISLQNENKGVDSLTDFSVGGFAIAVGVIIFFIAFFGCCGAIKESSCLLTTYAIIMILLFILQLVLGIMAFVQINKDDQTLNKAAHDAVKKVFDEFFKDPSNKDKAKVIDNIQSDWECCGVDNPIATWGLSLPKSCFKDENVAPQNLFKEGCAEAFKDIITDNISIIGGIAIGFAVVELVGAIFACMVRNNSR